MFWEKIRPRPEKNFLGQLLGWESLEMFEGSLSHHTHWKNPKLFSIQFAKFLFFQNLQLERIFKVNLFRTDQFVKNKRPKNLNLTSIIIGWLLKTKVKKKQTYQLAHCRYKFYVQIEFPLHLIFQHPLNQPWFLIQKDLLQN